MRKEDEPSGERSPEREAEHRIERAQQRHSTKLDLRGLKLTALPASIGSLTHVRGLDVGNNNLTELPSSFISLTRLQELDVSENRLPAIPDVLNGLTTIQTLYLHCNPLLALPPWLSTLTELRTITLSRTTLSGLPATFGDLMHLHSLDLDMNRLREVPECVRQLTELEDLYLAANDLASLPDWIGELTQLQMLSLNYNRLTKLPASLGALEKLELLAIERNALTSLPTSLAEAASLRELYLHDNPALGLPPDILGARWGEVASGRVKPGSASAILAYYFSVRVRPTRALNEAKLILVGRGEAGKTSIVERLVHDRFTEHGKTEGIQITRWKTPIDEKGDVTFNTWDFGGQEIMHATHQFFMTERSVYVLVLNGRQGGEDDDAEYWLRLIGSFGRDSPIVVVMNKITSQPFELNRRGLVGRYPNICAFVRTDCKDGSGVNELKVAIASAVRRLKHVSDPFPADWFAVKDRLSAPDKNYLTFRQFRELCAEHNIVDEADQDALAFILDVLGIALNYRDDVRLRDMHVLNPHWITNGVYAILNSPLLASKRGELDVVDLPRILDSGTYPSQMHDFLLGLLRKFDLCFRFPEPRDSTFLIPQLLGKEEPDLGDQFDPATSLSFRYDYPIWPEGLLPRFIVRTHALSANQSRWRTGVVLEFEGNRALVRAEPRDKRVFISISGPIDGRRNLLAIVRSDLERIHADFPRLAPIASVPLPEAPAQAIPYQELVGLKQSGVVSVTRVVGESAVSHSVSTLLAAVDVPVSAVARPVKLFVSYSHKDEVLRGELDAHLKLFERMGLVARWDDRRIPPGSEWEEAVDTNLKTADLILLLVSPDFFASDYAFNVEMSQALQRHAAGAARVVPIIVRPCVWRMAPFARIQSLPKDAEPVTSWINRDSAWRSVAEGLEQLILNSDTGQDVVS